MVSLYEELIKISDWHILMHSYDIHTIAKAMPFKEAIILAYRILYDKS